MQCVLQVNNRYDNWTWHSNQNIICTVDPVASHYFSGDIIEIKENSVKLINSPIREQQYIPGILVLSNCTYGRTKNNKFLYKCIPDNKTLPNFLIPYTIRPGFEKKNENIYILFSFQSWDKKHPHGKIEQNLGGVSILKNYYIYQLYCKEINFSINAFNRQACLVAKTKTINTWIETIMHRYPKIVDRRDNKVLTIDPENSKDFDDGFGIINNNAREITLSIYIANVSIWLEMFNLWDYFSQRISTIYLPDQKKSMLPAILSDNICSLKSGEPRVAFTMDITINKSNGKIIDVKYLNTIICVYKNYVYDDPALNSCLVYGDVFNILSRMISEYPYLKQLNDSHDVVAYLMILMNHKCAQLMTSYKNGIYRSMDKNNISGIVTPPELDFLKYWKCESSKYSLFKDNKGHFMMADGLDSYIHITSPIRRIVDLLNIVQLQNNLKLISLPNADLFYKKWVHQLDNINVTMKKIKKIQTDCEFLDMCFNNTDLLNEVYEGIVFDGATISRNRYEYMVYLVKLKKIARIKIHEEIDEYDKRLFKLYYLDGEGLSNRKIRLEIVGEKIKKD